MEEEYTERCISCDAVIDKNGKCPNKGKCYIADAEIDQPGLDPECSIGCNEDDETDMECEYEWTTNETWYCNTHNCCA